MSPTCSACCSSQKAGAGQQHPGQYSPDKSITSTSITLYKRRVIVMGSWRLINISCFENKLLGLALTLIYHQEPIISRPMFCSIDLLHFFFSPPRSEYNCISPGSTSTNCSPIHTYPLAKSQGQSTSGVKWGEWLAGRPGGLRTLRCMR